MSDEVVRGSYALHLQLRFQQLIGVLGVEELEEPICSYTNQGALGRVGMEWTASMYYAAIELILSVLANGWPVCDIELSMVRVSERCGVGLG